MLLLALDTSTPAVTAAVVDLSDDVHAVAERTEVATNRHGELLAPLVRDVLAAARRPVDAVAVGLGPGPFTGLRVGVVTAASMADALGVPAYAVCSLDAIALRHRDRGDLVVVTDARRKQVYWATYDASGARRDGPHVDLPATVAERSIGFTVVGAGLQLYPDAFAGCLVDDTDGYPRATAIARLVADRARAGEPRDVLEPLYLRRPDAVPPGPRKLVTPA